MTDPRNVAHDKKVRQAKQHRDEDVAPGAGKKTHMAHHASEEPKLPDEAAPEPTEETPLV